MRGKGASPATIAKLPTAEWTEKEVEMTLATAHLWMSIFGESSAV